MELKKQCDNQFHIKNMMQNKWDIWNYKGKIILNNPIYCPLPVNNFNFWKILNNSIFAFILLRIDPQKNKPAILSYY